MCLNTRIHWSNFGDIFDSQLAVEEQGSELCQQAYLEIRPIASLQQ